MLSNEKLLDRKGWTRVKDGDKVTYINDTTGEVVTTNFWDASGIDPKTWKDIETKTLKEYTVNN